MWRTGVEVTGNVCSSRGGHERRNGNEVEGFKAFEPERAWFRSESETSNALNPERRKREDNGRFKAFESEGLGFARRAKLQML